MAQGRSTFDKRTLRQRCTTHVRELVVAGQIRPGEHLVETRLSDELGVSRSTLREALRPLEAEGLLVDDGRGHLSVRTITVDEIREVFEVREALEMLAAGLVARRADRADCARQLRDALRRLDDDLDFATQISVDLGFHELLCALSGNRTLVESWRRLMGQIEMMIVAVGPAVGSSRMKYQDHAEIVDVLETGAPEDVRAAIAEHFERFAATYLGDHLASAAG